MSLRPGLLAPRIAPPAPVSEDPITERVAENIRRMRKLKNLSQRQLAERLGVNRNWISKIECGGCTPSLDGLQRIATALGVTLLVLVDPSHEPEAVETALLKDPLLRECLELAKGMHAYQREQLLLRIRSLALVKTVRRRNVEVVS